MPAACTLLLLLLLGLVPPAGSLPLASPRRLPPPPPPSRSRFGRSCSPPAAGHAGSPVIESTGQARGSDTEIRTSGALVDGVELATMLARNGEQALLPAGLGGVLAASEVTGHIGPLTRPGAGPSASPSAGITTRPPTHAHPPAAGSHHHAVGSRERGKRALASPSTPATAESTPLLLAAISTNSAETTLGRHHRAWDMVEFDSTTRTVLPTSPTDTRHPAIGSSYQPSSVLAAERRGSDFPTTSTSISTTATKGGERTLRSMPASSRLVDAAEISTSGTEITSVSDQTWSSLGAQGGGGGRGAKDLILTGSPAAPDSASMTFSSNYEPKSIPAAEEVTLYLDTHGDDVPSVAAGAQASSANSHTARVTRGSATSTNPTSVLGETSFLGARTHHPNGSQEATDLPTPEEPSLTSSLSASGSTLRGVRSSHRAVNSLTTKENSLASSPMSTFISAKATGSSRRPLRFATDSSGWATEDSTSSSSIYRTLGTIQSSSLSSVRETYGVHGPRRMMDFTEQVADPSLTHSDSPQEGPSQAPRSSHVSFSTLSREKRTDYPTTAASISITTVKGGGRTLRSLPSSTRLTQTTEISTTGTKTFISPDHTWSSSGAQGSSGRGATALSMMSTVLLTGSPPASESASPERTSPMGGHLPDVPLTSTPSLVVAISGGERSTVPASDTHAAFSPAGSSTSAPFHTSYLDGVFLLSSSEPGRQSHISQSAAGLSELSTRPLPAFSPSISVPSPSPSASVPERGRRVSGASTETTYISTTLSGRKEGASQPAVNHGVWGTAAESLTSYPDTATEPRTGPLLSSTAWPGARHVWSSQAGYPEPKFTLSSKVSTYFSAASEPATMGRIHHSLSSQNVEEGMSSPMTDPAYSSSSSAGSVERTLPPVLGSTLAAGAESSASRAEAGGAPRPAQAAERGGTASASASSGGSAGSVTETLFTRSPKAPTRSSFRSDLTSFPSSHQPVSSIDAEKRTSVSHTDGTYISTTYTRGGERTLLSISNSSTSADSSESSTFFSEISSPSDSSKSPVAQDRRSNISSNGSFVEPSTKPLLVHSSKLMTSASADSIQNTTVFSTDSEMLTTGRSSLGSSAFPASPSLSSLHHSLSSTPPPLMFTTSESSEPLSSSVMASSPPLQALSSSLPTSSLLSPSYPLVSLLPLFSSPPSISQSNNNDQASTPVATTVVRRVPSTAAVAGSSPRGTNKHSVTQQPPNRTIFTSTESPFPTAPMEQLGGHIATLSAPTVAVETASPRAATAREGSFGRVTPLLTTASDTSLAATDTSLSASPTATNHSVVVPAVVLTTVKPPVLTTLATTPGDTSTAKARGAETPAATEHMYTTGESTQAMGPTTARPGKVTEESIPVTSPKALATSKTTVSTAATLAGTKPTTNSPLSSTAGLRMSSLATDVDKCLSNPCPALATCNNTHGSYVCQCPLGYELERGKCNLVRIFIGQVPLKLNITHGKYTELLHVEEEILTMLNASLSGLPGYHHSTVKATREANFVHVSVQSTFSLASNVTFYDVVSSVKSYIRACKSPTDACQLISSLRPLHRVGSLCKQKDPECDKETSECTDFDGVALCQCKSGYFKYNKMDHSCRACEDGYKLENETCVSCPFGLGGFNCGNPYQLITVVIAAAGGGLLLIMGIALIVTCCRKNKNDISKLIFKSGDFQMSPYAEYPKNPRAQEWGRETIEMQENGSTKNLLQMTDVYYSPTGLRNPELERNGLYPPYTGLPGSRHSCIYPGQYNPSFISDETRRRDYF
ncbi:protein HEG homolog 1 isoform X2 [Pogoniulus pusillus]|uniref:protein HEG homolog 1 isoform X2 n=1 Tax=Pogoniulus pusillus TaxID=488313 RepID=UPI0030B9A4D7